MTDLAEKLDAMVDWIERNQMWVNAVVTLLLLAVAVAVWG